MRTFAVGDIQGCYSPLRRLLDSVAFDFDDQLWVAGDLVNRGPDSLATLRYLKNLGKQCQIVLGNHDLHLLAIASGARKARKGDTLAAVLEAPDCDELLHWLRQQPLIHHDAQLGFTILHAGVPPGWTLQQALALAAEVEGHVRSEGMQDFFAHMYGDEPLQWDNKLAGYERLRCIVNCLTRIRFCTADDLLDLQDKAHTESSRPGFLPWFRHSNRATRQDKIIFGHWAALRGETGPYNVFALDTACVWGNELTLLQLENESRYSCPCPKPEKI